MEIGAVQGLVAGTLSLVQDGGVTHLGAAFDTVIRSFRNDLFPGYKTEAGVPADLLAQFPIAEEGLEALGVVVWRMTTYEADDALATAAARFAPQAEQVVLMSPDKDLAQCVRGSTWWATTGARGPSSTRPGCGRSSGWRRSRSPTTWPWWATAPTACPGCGAGGPRPRRRSWPSTPTSRTSLWRRALWKPAVRGPERLVEALRGSLSEALVYRFLATLRRDVPLRESLDDLEWRGVPRQRFLDFCERWGFGGLRGRPKRWQD